MDTNGMNDNSIANLVNELRDIAEVYGQTQQLRARIAAAVVPVLRELNNTIEALEYECKEAYERNSG